MTSKLPKLSEIKNWSVEIESKITPIWKKEEKNNFNPKTKKKIYSIDTPPPYINTPIHMGHAVTYSFMDMFARFKRMTGFEVLFPLGLDRNGLPIEMAAEKKFKTTPFKEGRDKFIELCEKMLKETSSESEDSFSKLGISFSSYHQENKIGSIYLTDSPEYRKLTQATFIRLYREGLIYEDNRINNWDPKLQTTIADAEIDYKDVPSTFNDILWKVKETGEKIIIGTTRPELICTCGMVIYNPKDERYKHLLGKTAISPIFGKEVPITEHPLAKIDKGTGLVMMCSAGDLSDIQFFREMNLKPVIAINKDGKMNENAGLLNGLKVEEARQKILGELKKENLLKKQENIQHNTPISERSGAEIEFIEMPEFYLKQLELKDEIRKISNKINFYPEESKKILDSWLDSVSIDWPISRRRFYATPIPLWHSEKDNLIALPPEGKYYQPWKEKAPKDSEVFKNGEYIGKISEFPKVEWKGEERVLDTWFDSSISELFILQYQSSPEFFKKAYPASLRPQGKEIVRTWLYYTILRGYIETKKPCFEDVWVHQHILDEKGRKMSKSIGNSIDPQIILKQHGAEALRFWSAIEGDLSKSDFSCSIEKIKAEMKTLNKLINVTRFVLQFEKPKKQPKLTALDSLLLDNMQDLIFSAKEQYNKYDFYHPAIRQREFLWETFASHYIEMVKSRAYNEQKLFSEEESNSAKYTLHNLLENLIILLYPIIPQVTTIIAEEISLSLEEFPKGKSNPKTLEEIQKIKEFNSQVWKAKKEQNISLKESISKIEVPKNLEEFKKDFISCHNLK
ncbi:valine--tRNA ligase [Candidatus Pacearchaeota archaeon CG10_big_fil_rev_8_21_14_0_10_31_24]|nr:MAG: valine--tRNA ligase [Candidatus Pacearchaeota archaeon CG10_big_fil_rev_8_21_14_0_10_31_24]